MRNSHNRSTGIIERVGGNALLFRIGAGEDDRSQHPFEAVEWAQSFAMTNRQIMMRHAVEAQRDAQAARWG